MRLLFATASRRMMDVFPHLQTGPQTGEFPAADPARSRWPALRRRLRNAIRLPTTRWLVLAGVAVVLMAGLAAGLLLLQLHRRTIEHAERELGTLALVLAHYTENTFRSVELLQKELADLVEGLNIQTFEQFNERLTSRAVNLEMHARIAAVPQVEAVFFTNAEGMTVASTRAWPQRPFSIADRPHFAMLRDHPELRSYLAPPAANVQTGTWNIYLTRRLTAADGSFLGVAGVGIGLTAFQQFLGRIALDEEGAIALWRQDGVLMARYPEIPMMMGRSLFSQPLTFQRILAEGLNGTGRTIGVLDGKDRILAVHALGDYPVVVAVSRSTDAVLALWQRQAGYTIGALFAFAIAVLGTVALGVRQLRNRAMLENARTELRLAEEQHRAAARIAHLAQHDALTGLANRVLLRNRLEQACARARRGDPFAVLYIDLDHFKDVNDTLGHRSGDLLLQAVTARMLAEVREADTVARLGGDEFAVLQCGMRQSQDAGSLAERLVESLGQPYDLDGHRVTIGASIGIAVAPADGLEPEQLLQNADLALYRVKAEGRASFRFFEPGMNAVAQMKRTLQLDLRRALEAGEFELAYQPQVDVARQQIAGFEAFLRWRHPEHGLVMPDRLIPLAEETRVIVPLGEWVLEQACRAAVTWPGRLKVAVNLSAVQFASSRLVGAVAAALERSGLEAGRLELEVNETVMLRDTKAALATLHRLKRLGVVIVLDDFGAGNSALNHLQRFPFDKVKIDRGFIRHLGRSEASGAILRAMTDLCRALDMTIAAEGVETEEQYLALRTLGCTEAQGYLFGFPGPAKDLPAMLQRLSRAGFAPAGGGPVLDQAGAGGGQRSLPFPVEGFRPQAGEAGSA